MMFSTSSLSKALLGFLLAFAHNAVKAQDVEVKIGTLGEEGVYIEWCGSYTSTASGERFESDEYTDVEGGGLANFDPGFDDDYWILQVEEVPVVELYVGEDAIIEGPSFSTNTPNADTTTHYAVGGKTVGLFDFDCFGCGPGVHLPLDYEDGETLAGCMLFEGYTLEDFGLVLGDEAFVKWTDEAGAVNQSITMTVADHFGETYMPCYDVESFCETSFEKASSSPTSMPTQVPSVAPSAVPSASPSAAPSLAPSAAPSAAPSPAPSMSPTMAPVTFIDFVVGILLIPINLFQALGNFILSLLFGG